ncbi:MAG: hypothetical protein WCJ29_03515 [bacterium]
MSSGIAILERPDTLTELLHRRKEDINRQLRALKLVEFPWLGNYKNHEFELVAINHVSQNKWFALVEFTCIKPDGSPGIFFLTFSRDGTESRGCVVLNVLTDPETDEDFVAIVRQHRPGLLVRDPKIGAWQNEIPRMWSSTQVQLTKVDKLLNTAMRATPNPNPTHEASLLCGEMMELYDPQKTRIEERRLLAEDVPENTGDSTKLLEIWLFRLTMIDREAVMAVRGTKTHRIKLIPLKELVRNRVKHGLTDNFSGNALLFLWEHMNILRI